MAMYKFKASGPNVILAAVVGGFTIHDHVGAVAAHSMGLALLAAAKEANPEVGRLHEEIHKSIASDMKGQLEQNEEEGAFGPLPPHPGEPNARLESAKALSRAIHARTVYPKADLVPPERS